jgi:PAS domain S-box-containing protein
MTWITILWPMVTGACVTMALLHLRTGLRQRPGAAHLLFSLNAFVVAVFSCLELASTRVGSPAQFLELQRWLDIMGAALFVSLTAFVWVFLGTGRKWLAFLGPVVMCVPLILDLLPQPKALFLEMPTIRTVQTFAGATYTVADGARNPLLWVFYLGVLLILVFVADASVTLWRQGTRRRAAVVGGTITLFVLGAGVQANLVDAGILRTPYLVSFAYLAIVMAMGAELSDDVVHAAQLARDLRESEARMTLAANAANLGLWMWTVPQDKVWATEKLNLMLGFAPGAPITLELFLMRLHSEDRDLTRQALQHALKEESDYSTEYRVVLPDGHHRWIAAHGRVERPSANGAVRMLGVCIDITARKQAEGEELRQRAELAHLSRVTMLGELSSSLAHELNQPLGAILRNTEAAELFLQDPSPDLEELRAILADIRSDDQRAGAVIDRMRSLLKRREVEHNLLDLNVLVSEVVGLVRPDAGLRKVQLALEAVSSIPLVRGDRVQLQQVLLNLLLNAMDAVNDCAPDRRQVIVRVQPAGTQVEVTVSDTGHGIPSDKSARLFEPFFTTKANGMGMGLPISRRIMEAHLGSIRAGNGSAAGATFHFSLPVAKEESAS